MTTSLRVQATVTADGRQASVELTNLTAKVADARIAVDAQKEAARKLSAELKTVNRDTAEGAARANEIRDALRASRIAVIEHGAAAAAASNQMRQLSQATGQAGNSAGQMRAATANLGQQIGDISQGLALGFSPMTIFAQQGGQVAFAMSGMGGAIGRVATFLSGPWGAVITGAAIVLGSLASAHNKAADTADAQGQKAKSLSESIADLDRATGISNRSMAENIRLMEKAANASLALEQRKRSEIAADVEAARVRVRLAQQDANVGGARGQNFGSFNVLSTAQAELAAFSKELDDLDKKNAAAGAAIAKSAAFGRAEIAARSATDPRAKITTEFEAERDRIASLADQRNSEALLTAAMRKRDAALSAIKETSKAATAAEREHNKELRDAASAAEKAATALATFYAVADKGRIEIGNRDANFKGSDLITAADARPVRPDDLLARSVDEAERVREAYQGIGSATAKAFTASTLADAGVIGQAIGGGLGRAFSGVAALGFGTQNANGVTTDLTGVGSKLTTLLEPLTSTFRGNGKFLADKIGAAAGGAATGGVISGIGDALGIKNSKVGASIGGAIGGAIPIPGGEIIGSILGGLVGGLFGPKGSTTISASGGKVSSASTGSAAVQKATGAIGNTITDALTAIADQLGGSIGDFSVSIGQKKGQFRVDRSGQGRLNGGTVTGTDSESEALSLALADALRDGAVKTSPRVQAALLKYADNVNKAVAEALKVKGLEDLLADRNNPFLATFRALETQLKQRVDVARENGFNLVEIEKINGEDRARALKDTLAAATGSVRNLLNDLTIGSGATGSPTQRLAGLTAERDRLSGLARGGDGGQLDAIASIVKQIDDLQKETFGSTGAFASGRADSVALLNDLIRQTEDRARSAAEQARGVATTTVDKLTELNASADDQVALLADSRALLAQIAAGLGGGAAGGGFLLASEYSR